MDKVTQERVRGQIDSLFGYLFVHFVSFHHNGFTVELTMHKTSLDDLIKLKEMFGTNKITFGAWQRPAEHGGTNNINWIRVEDPIV